MQTSALVEKLQGLFSRATLIASVLPILCFAIANTAMAACFNGDVRQWFATYAALDGASKTIAGLVIAFALVLAAYVFGSFNLVLRELLEGKTLPRRIAAPLIEVQYRRRAALERKFKAAVETKGEIERRRQSWIDALIAARREGAQTNRCAYLPGARPREVMTVVERISRNEPVSHVDLESAVRALEAVLKVNSAETVSNADATTVASCRWLDADQELLVTIIDEAIRRMDEAMVNAYNQLEFDFSRFTLAPTRMGNIGESVRSYARSRYDMNLDFMWTRFQRVLQNSANASYFQTLQDSKAQVDFAVFMVWLVAISTAVWLVVLPLVASSFEPIIATAIIGPFLAWLMYQVALQNYRSFADLLRGSIDLFRMEVLAALKLDQPLNSEAEREMWRTLDHSLATGERQVILFQKDPK